MSSGVELWTLISDGVLAFTKGVPQLDGLVSRPRNDLSVVNGEGNGENVLGVADESSGSFTRVDLPKSEGTVP